MIPASNTIDLSAGALAVRVARQGGAILEASFDGLPFLVPGGGPEGTIASFPLVPFGNRVEHNGFAFEGAQYHFQPNSQDPLYLHGDGWLALWDVEEFGQAHVVLSLRHPPDQTSPYDYCARQTLSLAGETLRLQLSVSNQGGLPLPYGLGQHPFFARTPQTRLTVRAPNFWSERAGHLPGHSGPVPDGLDFSGGAHLPDRFVNNAFAGWDGFAGIEWPELGLAADVEATPVHDIFMLYMPSDRRDFFCFEPMTHLPNGHHMPDHGGLKRLAGADSMRGEITIHIRRL